MAWCPTSRSVPVTPPPPFLLSLTIPLFLPLPPSLALSIIRSLCFFSTCLIFDLYDTLPDCLTLHVTHIFFFQQTKSLLLLVFSLARHSSCPLPLLLPASSTIHSPQPSNPHLTHLLASRPQMMAFAQRKMTEAMRMTDQVNARARACTG